MATISLPVSGYTGTELAIYRSTDKVNWTSIGGRLNSNNTVIQVNVPAFSYFVLGYIKTGYIFDRTFGSGGSGDGYFDMPKGITIDSSNYIYVYDIGGQGGKIQKFNSSGSYISKFSTRYGSIDDMAWLAHDPISGTFYLTINDYAIYKYSSTGLELGSFYYSKKLSGIAVDSSGKIYAGDIDNNIIKKFDSDPNNTVILQFGSYGTATGQFNSCKGIGISSEFIYIADEGNNRIQKFNPNGTYISSWGTEGSGDGQFKSPQGVALDSSGYVYVTDPNNYRVQKFDSSGKFISKFGSQGDGASQFKSPTYISVNSGGYVYIVDIGKGSVIVYRPQ
jgi:sugar lactone lactonase YvrE